LQAPSDNGKDQTQWHHFHLPRTVVRPRGKEILHETKHTSKFMTKSKIPDQFITTTQRWEQYIKKVMEITFVVLPADFSLNTGLAEGPNANIYIQGR
jgi:hypothetical protein